VNPPDFLAAIRRWRPDLVTVIEAPGFAEELASEVNRASGDRMVLLIAPMPAAAAEQAPTQIGIILPQDFDARRPKKLIGSLIQALSLNPVTKLVGSWALQAHVERKLSLREDFAFLYLDINDFKPYDDCYGLAQGDAAIRLLGDVVSSTVRKRGTAGDLAAHIGGDDFAILTSPDRSRRLAAGMFASFASQTPSLYSREERERGEITSTNRRGEIEAFGLMSLAIASVRTTRRRVRSYQEVCDIAAELKTRAKREPKRNRYVEERRRGEDGPSRRSPRGG